jgi:hypothetical protein
VASVVATARRGALRAWAIAVVAGLVGGGVLGAASAYGRDRLRAGAGSFWLENVGGPWIVVAFAAGAARRRRGPGALAGSLATIAALAVYELTKFASLPDTLLLVRPTWLALALVVGLVFGSLGGWWGEQPTRNWLAPGLAGGVVAGEVLALSIGGLPHPRFSGGLAALQAMIGLAGATLLGLRAGWWRAGAMAVAVALVIAAVEAATGVVTRLVW